MGHPIFLLDLLLIRLGINLSESLAAITVVVSNFRSSENEYMMLRLYVIMLYLSVQFHHCFTVLLDMHIHTVN